MGGDNVVVGSDNKVKGRANNLAGGMNDVTGATNVVKGDSNLIQGDDNIVVNSADELLKLFSKKNYWTDSLIYFLFVSHQTTITYNKHA